MKFLVPVRRSAVAFGVLSTLVAIAQLASAQPEGQVPPEDPSVVAAARAIAVEGVKLAQDGRCADAIEKLERAEQLRHSSIVQSQLGECYISQGRFVQGAEAMRAVLREGLPENPSDAMKRAYAVARTQLDLAKNRIGSLTIALEDAAQIQATVTIDGQPIPAALIGAARPTDPGEHTVEASAPGYLPAKRRVTLAAGAEDSITLALVADPARGASNLTAAETPAPNPAPAALQPSQPLAASGRPNRIPAFIVWGTGAAAIAVGVGFGWVAMNQTSDLERACPNKRCPPEQSARLDVAKTNGVISSVAFGVGAAAIATGAVLLFLAADREEAPRASLGLDGANLQLSF